MPEQRAPKWTKNGEDAAQLFRDFYFHKYNKKTSIAVIHQDPTREYSKYNQKTFATHLKNIQNRVTTYREFGTGLDNLTFRKLVALDRPPQPADCGTKKQFNSKAFEDSETDNEDFSISDTTDKSFDPDTFEEDDLTLDKEFEKLSVTEKIMPPMTRSSEKPLTPWDPFAAYYVGGLVFVRFVMETGLRGPQDIKLVVSDCRRKVIKMLKVKKSLITATGTLSELVTYSTHCKHHEAIQNAMNKKKWSEANCDDWVVREVLQLDCKVHPHMVDATGEKLNTFFVNGDNDGTMWICIWFEKATANKSHGSNGFVLVGEAARQYDASL